MDLETCGDDIGRQHDIRVRPGDRGRRLEEHVKLHHPGLDAAQRPLLHPVHLVDVL